MARYFRLLIIIALGAFLLLNVMAYWHAHSMLYFSDSNAPKLNAAQLTFRQKIEVLFTGINMPRSIAKMTPESLGYHCSDIRITYEESSHLGAWYCPDPEHKRLVILFHGYATDKSSLLNVARFFIAEKYSVLLVDFRGSGESSESYTTIGYAEADDVATVFNYAQQNFSHKKILLYGQSMGAAAILRAIHSLNVRIDALIVESVFDNLLNTVKNRFDIMNLPTFPAAYMLVFWGGLQTGFNGFKHNPVIYAERVDTPILFLHGKADMRAKLSEAQQVYEAIPVTDKKLSIFPKAAHESLLAQNPTHWKTEVRHFAKKYLIIK